jgi:hypothetical protein
MIVHRRSLFTTEAIPLAAVATWTVTYEMVFDIVDITLFNGSSFRYLDKKNDLLEILREHAGEKRVW